MRDLFSLDSDGTLVVMPQAWLLLPFKAIQDKYKSQEIATVELCLVWYATDYRSSFTKITNVTERVSEVKRRIYANRKLKINEITYEAIKFYEEWHDTPTISLLKAVNSGLVKATYTISTIDMVDLDEIKTFAMIVDKLPTMVNRIRELERAVKIDSVVDDTVVGTQEKGMYEDDN